MNLNFGISSPVEILVITHILTGDPLDTGRRSIPDQTIISSALGMDVFIFAASLCMNLCADTVFILQSLPH